MKFETPCACATLRRAARAVTAAYDAALAPSGLRITQFGILRKLARLGPLPVTRLAAEAALDRSTMGRNLNPLERRGLVRIEVGNVDQRERVAYLTAAGEAAIEAALPYWRKAQERIAALVQPSAIGELADQLDALGAREADSRVRKQQDDRKMQPASPTFKGIRAWPVLLELKP
jgi:DNA-binding MarR family transcriptional regulator